MWNLQYFHFPEILHNDEGIVGEYGFDNIHSYSWGRWRKMAKLHADAGTILKIENETKAESWRLNHNSEINKTNILRIQKNF